MPVILSMSAGVLTDVIVSEAMSRVEQKAYPCRGWGLVGWNKWDTAPLHAQTHQNNVDTK